MYTRHWCCTNNQNICQNIASTMDIPELSILHSGSGVGLSNGHMHFESIRNPASTVYLVVGLVLTNGHMHPRGILFCMNIVDIVVGLVLVKVHLYFGKVYCTTHHL